jgi:hypothetical protein
MDAGGAVALTSAAGGGMHAEAPRSAPFTLSLRDGEKHVIDLRRSRRLVVVNTSDRPVRIQVDRRNERGWSPLSGDVWLPPGTRWWRRRHDVASDNVTIVARGTPGVAIVQVSF